MADLSTQAHRMFYAQATPAMLNYNRQSFVADGGYALVDAHVDISDPWKLLRYLPRALLLGFFSPLPWQWFDAHGSTGPMRILAGLEVLLIYALTPAFVLGVGQVLRSRSREGALLLAVGFVTAIPVSLVVANIGTLFRLRLLFLLPLLIIAGWGDPVTHYPRIMRWRPGKGRRTPPPADAPPGSTAVSAPEPTEVVI